MIARYNPSYRLTTRLNSSVYSSNLATREREIGSYLGSRIVVALLILAAFGPYVAGPVRTEQLAGYGLALVSVVTILRLKMWSLWLLGPWLWIVGIASAATFLTYQGKLPWDPGSVLSGFDNLLLPIAIMLIAWTLLPTASLDSAFRTAAQTLVWASAVNAVLAIITSLAPAVIVPALQLFWSAEDGSVAENAMEMGRFSGVFNQPAEAGVIYSLAAILAVWAYSNRAILMYVLITLITVGGMLSVSKVFLLIGLPVMLTLLWLTRRGADRLWMVGMVVLLGMFTVSSTFIQDWAGYDYMMRLLEVPQGESVIQFYTAGRWNEDAGMRTVLEVVLAVSPLAGFGTAGLQVPYDSQWTETMVMSGILGTIGLVIVFVAMLMWFLRIRPWDLRLTAFAIWLVLFFGSFGITTLTANRVSTGVWVIVALLVAIAARGISRSPIFKEYS